MIQPVVEGHGDVQATFVLLRRFIQMAQRWEVGILPPMRHGRDQLTKRDFLTDVIRTARRLDVCRAVLILFDSDKDCPAELAPRLQKWAEAAAGGIPCVVVLAKPEFEAWFLASMESLRGVRDVRDDAVSHPDPENRSGAKGQLRARMTGRRPYIERWDQAALSQRFCLKAAYERCRSFRKLTRAVRDLLRQIGHAPLVWPPDDWEKGCEAKAS